MPTSAKECHTYIVQQKSKKHNRNAMTHDLSLGRETKKAMTVWTTIVLKNVNT